MATNSLRPFFASTGQVGAPLTLGNVGNNRAMLLQGFTDQVAAAIRLLRTVDVPQEVRDTSLDFEAQIAPPTAEELKRQSVVPKIYSRVDTTPLTVEVPHSGPVPLVLMSNAP